MIDAEIRRRAELIVRSAFGETPGPAELELEEIMRGLPFMALVQLATAGELIRNAARKLLEKSKTKESM